MYYADDYRLVEERIEKLTAFLDKHNIPSGDNEAIEDLANYLLEHEEELLVALGFEKTFGYGDADSNHMYEARDEEDALWYADRKPEQTGGDVVVQWSRNDWRLREFGAYDRILKLRKERADRKQARDDAIAKATAKIKAEYADVED